ncbi:hypothetical protein I3760_01G286400 [Carya illinoinensis]|nr:hypothetical protein I3760_01G286400 [Carya illinoinensis]
MFGLKKVAHDPYGNTVCLSFGAYCNPRNHDVFLFDVLNGYSLFSLSLSLSLSSF